MRGSVIPALLTIQLGVSHALRLPFRREVEPQTAHSTNVVFASANDPYNFSVIDFTGDNQIIYVANVTVYGQTFEVQLDTGSSDFWLNTQNITFTNVNSTNITATITYGDTTAASGDIILAPVQFGNFSVSQQALINAPGSNATSENDRGLLGLGPLGISVINSTLQNTSFNGLPLINNIFNLYPEDPNYVTFLLGRSNLGVTDGGIFTIAEVDPNWTAVVNQSKVAIIQELDQWIGLMDGVIVNGKNFTGNGLLSKPDFNASSLDPSLGDPSSKEKLLSVFDTGTALGYMPQYYFDAVYKDITGLKELDSSAGIYSLPCDTKLNVSMVFNGTEYPVNPLDLTRIMSSVDNDTICINTFAPKDLSSQGMDFILGDAFLRNAYALFNYGNWTNNGTEASYVQLLSTTNQSEAWAQFDALNDARIAQWESLNGTFTP